MSIVFGEEVEKTYCEFQVEIDDQTKETLLNYAREKILEDQNELINYAIVRILKEQLEKDTDSGLVLTDQDPEKG